MLCDQIRQAAVGSEKAAEEVIDDLDARLMQPTAGEAATERAFLRDLQGMG